MIPMLLRNKELLKRAISASIIGLCAALSYWGHVAALRLPRAVDRWLILLYLIVLSSAVVFLILPRVLRPLRPMLTRRTLLLAIGGALLVGAFVGLTLNPTQPTLTHQLTIEATGQKNASSQGSEVWVGKLQRADGKTVPATEFALNGQWDVVDNVPVARKQYPASLSWTTTLTEPAQLHLVAHQWSGIARVTWDGNSQTVDLYAAQSTEKVIALPVNAVYVPSNTAHAATQFADALLIALLCFIASIWVISGLQTPSAQQRLRQGYYQLRDGPVRRDRRWYLANIGISLLIVVVGWIGLKTAIVPDDKLNMHMSAQADSGAQGTIHWGTSTQPYQDGWLVDLAALHFNEPQPVDIRIEALPHDQADPASQGNEVWLYDIETDAVPDLNWQQTSYDTQWTKETSSTPSGFQIKTSGSQPSAFVYHTKMQRWVNISFLHFPWAGKVKVTIGNTTNIIDLFQAPDKPGGNQLTTFKLPSLLDEVGILALPLPQNRTSFTINFGNQTHRLRLYNINRVGRTTWQWHPGMPLQTDPATKVVGITADYVEIDAPQGNAQISFDRLPIYPYYLPGRIGSVFLLVGFLICFGFLYWRETLWRILLAVYRRAYSTLTTPSPELSIGRLRWIILGLAFVVRLKFALEDPLYMTPGDSEQYLRSAFWIKHGLTLPWQYDWFDFRGPGYPAFIAVLFLVLGTSYTSIIAGQFCLGLLTVYGGIRFGELLGFRSIAVLVGLFLAVSPDYIWYEHTLLTEVLSTSLMVWCCVLGLKWLREPHKLRFALLFGLCSACIIYVRPNLGPIIGFWFLALLAVALRKAWQWRNGNRRLITYWCLSIVTIVLIITPWVIRSGVTYGRYSMLAASSRAQFIFWVEARMLDLDLPRISQLGSTYSPQDWWLWGYQLGNNRAEGETIAHQLTLEQVIYRPDRYRARLQYSINNLLGWELGGTFAGQPRWDISWGKRTFTEGQDTYTYNNETIQFTPYGEYGRMRHLLEVIWTDIFNPARFTITILALLSTIVLGYYVCIGWLTREQKAASLGKLLLFGLSCTWIITLAALAFNLAYGVRYGLPFAWLQIALISGAGETLYRSLKHWTQTMSASPTKTPVSTTRAQITPDDTRY